MGDTFTTTKKGTGLFLGVTDIAELIRVIRSASLTRTAAVFGITKTVGVSIEKSRKQANADAIALLDSLPPDFDGYQLTDAQRQTLAGYTGLGGIGGSEYEYYTPQHVAEGMWDMMKAYGAETGNMLEPSAATGVFQETKPKGVICTSTEISEVSGRINQLLHPEDEVSLSPFEKLAANTPDDYFDSCLGNVPFGASRGGFAHFDPAYSDIKNVGVYFVLRLLDKIKPNGLACIVVPYGMTSGKTYTKLREQVSRKAEFLGAHRLPSGTFEENGTATAVDIWVLRKHPVDLAEKILIADDAALVSANVLWETYLSGKWFERDGSKFQHGESSIEGSGKFKRLVVKNDQITAAEMKKNLAHKFDSRIDWDAMNLIEPVFSPMAEGEKRFINGRWYQMEAGRLVYDASVKATTLNPDRYGVTTYEELLEQVEGVHAKEQTASRELIISSDIPTNEAGVFIELSKNSNSAHNSAKYEGLKMDLKTIQSANEVIESLRIIGKLPSYFLTKKQAVANGWRPGKVINNTTPGGQIGGDVFENSTNILPSVQGRIWYEVDIGLNNTISRSKQPGTRLLYSNDGLLYITTDHYETVTSIGRWKWVNTLCY